MPDDIVSVSIDGVEFSGWESITITRSLETCTDAFSLSAPFDPERPEIVKAFKPFGYQSAQIKVDDELILTGKIESVTASLSAGERMTNAQGRSIAGAIVESSIDGAGYQFSKMSLFAIAEKLCKPFGVAIQAFSGVPTLIKLSKATIPFADAKTPIKEAIAQPGQAVFDFLNGLAQDQSMMFMSNAKGELVITRIDANSAPIAFFKEGEGDLIDVSASYDGTSRFSKYKVLQQKDGSNKVTGQADDSAIKVYRPLVATGSGGNMSDVKKAAEWKRALAISGSISIDITVAGWRTPYGAIWCPGANITLKAPSVFINTDFTFTIAEASLTLTAQDGKVSKLKLVLPSTYSGKTPSRYPWD